MPIGAGPGLSAGAGLDYGDRAAFARDIPAMVRRGTMAVDALTGRRLPPRVYRGDWGHHVLDTRFAEHRAPVCEQLREPVQGKDAVVTTSNVNDPLVRSGFDPVRLLTPQGDFARMQCRAMGRPACRDATWRSRPILERLVATTDAATGEPTDPATIPACPPRGGEVFLNGRGCAHFAFAP